MTFLRMGGKVQKNEVKKRDKDDYAYYQQEDIDGNKTFYQRV